ncbi:MAG: hypothetical protein IJM24_11295 [Clostridia bacterium]|nr:hypothetical protein [Clostridia bacterium]
MANGKWQIAKGKWQGAKGKLQMANGKLQMARGKGQTASCEPSDGAAFLGNEMLCHSLGFAGREKRTIKC